MQTSHEYGSVEIESRSGPVYAVGVGLHPGDHLYLFVAHAATGDLEVELSTVGTLRGAHLEKQTDGFLVLENEVHVPLGRMAVVLGFLSGPFHAERSELLESAKQSFLSYVPRHASEKYLRGVYGVPVASRGENAGPGADNRVVSVVLPVVLTGPVGLSGFLIGNGG